MADQQRLRSAVRDSGNERAGGVNLKPVNGRRFRGGVMWPPVAFHKRKRSVTRKLELVVYLIRCMICTIATCEPVEYSPSFSVSYYNVAVYGQCVRMVDCVWPFQTAVSLMIIWAPNAT